MCACRSRLLAGSVAGTGTRTKGVDGVSPGALCRPALVHVTQPAGSGCLPRCGVRKGASAGSGTRPEGPVWQVVEQDWMRVRLFLVQTVSRGDCEVPSSLLGSRVSPSLGTATVKPSQVLRRKRAEAPAPSLLRGTRSPATRAADTNTAL